MRKLALNLTILGAACGAAALMGEGLVRLVAPQQLIMIRPDIWQPADTVGYLHRPNVRTKVNTGERTVDLFTDAKGFRVGREGRRQASARVLVLGDSFMEALQVDYEQSFPYLLEQALRRDLAKPVAVYNAGIDGWGPNHYLLRGQALLATDTFDLVIVSVYVGNDVVPRRVSHFPPRQPALRQRLGVPRSLAWRELVQAWLAPINDALEVRSHLYILLRKQMETVRMRLGVSPAYFPIEFRRSEARSDRWDITAEILTDLADSARAVRAATLFVLLPAPYQVDSLVFEQYVAGFGIDKKAVELGQPNRLLDRELTSRRLQVVDALPGFRSEHTRGRRLFGEVDPHLTPEGHAVLTSIVAPVARQVLSQSPQTAAR